MTKLAPPTKLSLLREGLYWVDILTLPAAFLKPVDNPRTDKHPVTVIPGLGAGDSSMAPMRAFLKRHGYTAEGWGARPQSRG